MKNPYRTLSKINPQKEGHHREIANDVFDALVSARLSGGEYQVVLSIIERTWGHPRKAAGPAYSRVISLGHFEMATNLSRQGVIDAVYSLEKKRIIATQRNGTRGTEYLFNKHYDTWLVKQGLLVDGVPLVKQGLPDWSSRVDQSSQVELTSASQVPEPSTEPTIESIESIEIVEKGGSSPPSLGPETPSSKYLFEKTNRKRWQNFVQKEQFEKAEAEVGEARMKEARDWALTSGISNIKSIITASRRKKDGEPKRGGSGAGTHQQGIKEPSAERYRQSLERRNR